MRQSYKYSFPSSSRSRSAAIFDFRNALYAPAWKNQITNIIFRRQDGFIPLLKTKFLREAQSPTKAGA